jgi:hypothetical protein
LDEKQLSALHGKGQRRPFPTAAGKERRYSLSPGLNGEFPISVADHSGHKVFEIVYPGERSEEMGRFQIHDAAGSEIAEVRWPHPSWFSSAKSIELLLGDVPAGTIERKRRRFSLITTDGVETVATKRRLRRRYELTRAGRPAGILRGRLVQARWTYTLDLPEELDVVPLLCMVGLIHQERPSHSAGFDGGIA